MSVTDITQIYNNVPILWATPRFTTAYLWHGAHSRHLEVLLKPRVQFSPRSACFLGQCVSISALLEIRRPEKPAENSSYQCFRQLPRKEGGPRDQDKVVACDPYEAQPSKKSV